MYRTKTKLHAREKAHKRGDLRTIVLDVTGKCNMRCHFCYAETFAQKKPIELEVLHNALDEAYEMGVYHYVLQGGEVFADYERLKKVISFLHPDESYINIVSNGWLISKETLEELKVLQVDKITFSLDSGIENEHDANRMPGSFQRVLKAIDLVKESGLLTGISVVVTHQSLHSEGFKKAYKIAKEKGIRLDVQIAEPVGKWDANKECLITEADGEYIYDLYKNSPLLDNGKIMVKRDLYSANSVCKPCCPAAKDILAITVDGNVLPCNFIQASLGNIRDKSLKTMRNDILKSKWFSEEYPYCIIGESEEFFDDIVEKYKDVEKPLDAYSVFGLSPSDS